MTILLAALLLSQTFEAASVKPGPPANSGRFTMTGGPGTGDPTFLRYSNVPLKRVLMIAYDVKNWQISGPDWLASLRFDISARIPEGATKDQSLAMLRNLLVERFQMTVHRETRTLPIYALLPAKTGAKLKQTASEAGDQNSIATIARDQGNDGFPVLTPGAPGIVIETRDGRARISAFHSDLQRLADFLSTQLGHPVFDQTAIAGTFDFAVYFRPENAAPEDSNPYPGIFDALREQIGLRLDARKGPVEMLIVDRIEKTPAGNE